MVIKEAFFGKFVDFARQMIETKDIDASFYTLKGYCEVRNLSMDKRFELVSNFIAFYHFGSTERYLANPRQDISKMSYGVARRGFRANDKALGVIMALQSLKGQIMANEKGKEKGWKNIYDSVSQVSNMGDYTTYCFCHILKLALDFDITAPNIGYYSSGSNTGPIMGLQFVTGLSPRDFLKIPKLQTKVYEELASQVPLDGFEDFESLLCNFLSLYKKKYYVGRDIDRQLPALKGLGAEWFQARKKYFPEEILGEIKGWPGIRKDQMGKFEMGKAWV